MGDSACLMQTSSQASHTSHETSEGKPIHELAESVSFGRFLSESLDWEKSSCFSRNRHLEEVQKYSRPGSVAQMKAYFEAHYKKIAAKKAAALPEQENGSVSNNSTQDGMQNVATRVSYLTESDGHVAVDVPRQVPTHSNEEGFITNTSRCNSNCEMNHFETIEVEMVDSGIQVLEKNSLLVEPSNQLAHVGNLISVDQTHEEENDAASKETMSTTKTKPLVSSSKPSAYRRDSLLSSSSAESTSICSQKENIATPNSRKSARDSAQKKCSITKSLHMSINFSANQETLVSATKTKPAVSLAKPSAQSRLSGLPSPTSKSSTVHYSKENNSAPNSKNIEREPGNKKCSRQKGFQMSVNFAANEETLALSTKTKPAVSMSKPSPYSAVSRLPSRTSKSHTSVHCSKENNPTPDGRKSEKDPGITKCSTPKSHHILSNYAVNQESLASVTRTKTKPVISSSKPSVSSGTLKLPSPPGKPTAPVHSRKENNSTPSNKKSAGDLGNKKCSTQKSLHMSISFTPSVAGETFTKSSVWKKTVDSRRSGSLSKAKHCPTPLRTPTMASVNGLPKNPSVTPQSEKRSTRTELDLTAIGCHKEGAKWQSLSIDNNSKSLNAGRSIRRSATLPSPFSFRTDERAAKRKEKMESKYNAKGAQNDHLQMKSKEKAESELKKLRQSLGFKAKPTLDFNHETESGKNQLKKISLRSLRPPKLERKPISNAIQY